MKWYAGSPQKREIINLGHTAISSESTGQTFGHDIPLQKHMKISCAQQTLEKIHDKTCANGSALGHMDEVSALDGSVTTIEDCHVYCEGYTTDEGMTPRVLIIGIPATAQEQDGHSKPKKPKNN
jgi:hypothetical protein